MARITYLLPALALGLQLCAQGTPAKEGVKGRAESVATPALSANQGINPDELIAVRATPYRPTLQRDPFSAPTDAEQTNKGDMVDELGVKGMVD
ncbi:MAG: hypothetical protein HGA66_12400, partial [Holophaga sp.]|nr:hypothetical protein [Holophaga sp.]